LKYPESFTIFLKGLLMGMADIIPGVSGGTMALITNIYERLIKAIRDIDFRFILYFFRGDLKAARKNLMATDFALLVPLAIGILTAFVLLAEIISYLLDNHPAYVFAFFFGLIIASAGIVFDYVERLDRKHISATVAGFLLVFLMVGFEEISNNHSPPVIFLSGAIAICAMILPGISGALILLVLGQYEYMLDTLRDFLHSRGSDGLTEVGLFVAGAAVGLISFSRLLHHMIQHHRSLTMSFLFGLMLGALRVPGTKIADNTGASETLKIAGVVMAAIAGIIMIILIQIKSRGLNKIEQTQKEDCPNG